MSFTEVFSDPSANLLNNRSQGPLPEIMLPEPEAETPTPSSDSTRHVVDTATPFHTSLPDSIRFTSFLDELENVQNVTRMRRDLLVYKSERITWINNLLQISMIVASSFVTFLETLRASLDLSIGFADQAIPICLSTYIGLTVSIFKFFKMDEHREAVNQLVLEMTALLKRFSLIRSKIQDLGLEQDPGAGGDAEPEASGPLESLGPFRSSSLGSLHPLADEVEVVEDGKEKLDPSTSKLNGIRLARIRENFRQETYMTFLDAQEKFDVLMPYPELIRYKKMFAVKMLKHKIIEQNIAKVQQFDTTNPRSNNGHFVQRVSACRKLFNVFYNFCYKKSRVEIDFEAFDKTDVQI